MRKRKIQETFPVWVSASNIRNFMLKDTLVDWLKLYRPIASNKTIFQSFIIDQGNNFEKAIVNILTTVFPIVTISDKITDESCQETIEAIERKVPVIHSAPFRNYKNGTHGIIDLLVRSDYLHYFTDYEYKTDRDHYIAIDIKFSTLPLRADGIHLLNSGNYNFYKAQLRIYTEALEELQGFTPSKAFILGRRWNYHSKGEDFSGLSCFDKLGVIDFEKVDINVIDTVKKAIEWVRLVRSEGKEWSIDPPSRPELYPNMCVDSGEWNDVKKEIANKIGDITQIWYCGIKNREIGFLNGIKTWRDKKCTSKKLGINGIRSETIDKIISINRQNRDKIRPKFIENNLYDWKEESNEIFVDFETFCDVFADFSNLPEQPKTDSIFMIGVWYKNGPNGPNGTYSYRNFIAKNTSLEAEFEIMQSFISFVREQNNPKIWYWHAEPYIWDRSENRQLDRAIDIGNMDRSDEIVDNWRNLYWCDLCTIFREEPIVIKGCFKFGLKEVASALKQHGFISAELSSDIACKNGLDASVLAWKAYNSKNDILRSMRSNDILHNETLQQIELYNKFDVKVLYEILNFLRLQQIRKIDSSPRKNTEIIFKLNYA